MNTNPNTDPTLRDLVKVLDRRRGAVLGVAAAVFLIAVFLCIFMPRRYEASGIFQLEKSSSDALGGLADLASGAGGGGGGGGTDALSLNTDLQTEADILQSDTLALQVINELNLEQNEDFKPHFNPVAYLLDLITPKGPHDPPNASIYNSPRRRAKALKVFEKHLDVKVNSGTRLIEVDYSNRDPIVAAAVVNHLIQALIDFTFQTKFTATTQVSGWLEGQLGDLRKQSEDLQAKVVTLQQSSGIFGVGGTDLQGKPVVYSPILDRLQQSSTLLSQAQMNRVIKGSIYQVAKSGNAEMISQLAGSSIMSQAGAGVNNSLSLIITLRTQEATLKAQIGQDASTMGAAYPKLIEDRAALRSVEESLQDEIGRIEMRAQNDFEIAEKTEQGAQESYNKDQAAAEKLNDKTIEFTILSKESEESEELYQDLLKRLKEAGILEGLHSTDLTIVDVARPPDKPSRPNVPLYLALGLGLGIFFGGCSAFAVDAIDNKILGTDEIDAMHIPLLGIVPQIKQDGKVFQPIMLDSNYSEFSEAIRRLRSTILISRSGMPPKIILIASARPGEGKSTISLNLAAALAQNNKSVLLVEADMRRPVLKSRLQLTAPNGLSEVLADETIKVEPQQLPDNPNLYILHAGHPPPYPSELLGSAQLTRLCEEWRLSYDFVVLDSPPVLPVTDAQILEAQADSTILIARAGQTTKLGLQRSFSILMPHARTPGMPSIGVVLNFISARSAAFYGYYGYYGNQGYYGQKEK